LVLGPHLGIGRPYTDLWEFVPPGFLTVANAWVVLFGWSMISLRFLQITLLLVAGTSFLLIIKKIFKTSVLELVIFTSFVTIFYSPILQSDMLSIETFGIAFALLGLVSLLYIEKPVWKLALSGALFFLASQMKETFTFSVLALVPYYVMLLKRYPKLSTLRTIALSLLGPFLVVILIIIYLQWSGGWLGYGQILSYKITRVQPLGSIGSVVSRIRYVESLFSENFLHWHGYISSLIVLNLMIAYYFKLLTIKAGRSVKASYEFLIRIKTNGGFTWIDISGILFSVGIFLGIIMYGQYSVDTRQIPVVTAFFILIGVLLKAPVSAFNKFMHRRCEMLLTSIILAIVLIIFVSPQVRLFHIFFHQIKLHISGELYKNKESKRFYVRTSTYEVTNYIFSRTSTGDCILNPYGWEVAETYIYSRRKPCSRHFLANLMVQEEWQIEEYKKQVLDNPPVAILYNTNIIDLDIKDFAKKVIDYENILKHCYSIDNQYQKFPYLISGAETKINLYWKREDMDDKQFKSCFNKYAYKN